MVESSLTGDYPQFPHVLIHSPHTYERSVLRMSILFIVLSVVFLVGSLALVTAILLQKKRAAGSIGSIAGMGNAADTYWDKNKTRSMEGSLERLTKVGGALLAIIALLLCLL